MTAVKKSPVFFAILFALTGMMATLAAHASGPGNGSSHELSEDAEHYVYFMREEEQLARDTYLYLDQLWGEETPVFANIALSEEKHMTAMVGLMDKYGLTGPVIQFDDLWSDPDNLFLFADGWASGEYDEEEDLNHLISLLLDIGDNSKEEGAIVGALIEETDILDIQHAIEVSEDYYDIVKVYESLMCGSRNHLRGFWANLVSMGMAGYYYENLRILPPGEFNDIVGGDYEDCGSNTRTKGK